MTDLGEGTRYVGTKHLKAWPMTRGEYNAYREWTMPEDEIPEDAGYLVEYEKGGAPNHRNHRGYVSWSPQDVFEKSYHIEDEKDDSSYIDRLRLEYAQLQSRLDKLDAFVESASFFQLALEDQSDLGMQRVYMRDYVGVLFKRLNRILAKN